MTTLENIDTTSGRTSKRTSFAPVYWAVALIAVIGVASTLAVAQMSNDHLTTTVAKTINLDGPLAASPINVVHYEPFLATPRWNGSWNRSD